MPDSRSLCYIVTDNEMATHESRFVLGPLFAQVVTTEQLDRFREQVNFPLLLS